MVGDSPGNVLVRPADTLAPPPWLVDWLRLVTVDTLEGEVVLEVALLRLHLSPFGPALRKRPAPSHQETTVFSVASLAPPCPSLRVRGKLAVSFRPPHPHSGTQSE